MHLSQGLAPFVRNQGLSVQRCMTDPPSHTVPSVRGSVCTFKALEEGPLTKILSLVLLIVYQLHSLGVLMMGSYRHPGSVYVAASLSTRRYARAIKYFYGMYK